MVLWTGKLTDQVVRPAGQRQSKERAESPGPGPGPECTFSTVLMYINWKNNPYWKVKRCYRVMMFKKSSQVIFLPFYASSWYCLVYTTKTENLSLLSRWTVSAPQDHLPVHVQTIPTQDQESLSAPGLDCLCQARASSWSGGIMDTRDCYT